MGSLFHQIRQSLRGLLRSPLVSIIAVLALAVGISSAVAVFCFPQRMTRPAQRRR